ncbi:MAG TPA: tetratricopeptide repeat protein, partial [Salinivirgaceae bacterium]|nr:tetratricopeptide repeat protein [Salinivirgaceae bacterium]
MFFRVLMLFAAIALTLSAYGQMTPKNADDHFQMGNFEQALKIYEHLYKRDSTNTEYTHRVGVCHLNLTYDRAKAIPFLEKASTMKGVSNFIWFDLGSAYRYTGQFDKAKENLEKFIGITRNSYDKAQAELMLKQIENAKALMAKPVNVKFINLGANINSEFDDFYPYVDINNRWMIYNSRRIF